MNEPERTVLLTLSCSGRKTHTLAKIVRENGTDYIEATHLHGGYLPDGKDEQGQPISVVKGKSGRHELLAGDAALRAATRLRCSCGTTVLVADVTFREALAAGITKLLTNQVQQAILILDGADHSPEVGRIVLADTPRPSE